MFLSPMISSNTKPVIAACVINDEYQVMSLTINHQVVLSISNHQDISSTKDRQVVFDMSMSESLNGQSGCASHDALAAEWRHYVPKSRQPYSASYSK